jgi:hypothetical protein
MICYKDKTFCTFHLLCKNGSGCDRALTPKVIKDAKMWWGKDLAPIAQYKDPPECFVRFFEIDVCK